MTNLTRHGTGDSPGFELKTAPLVKRGLLIDSFAGGGGTSEGLKSAGLTVDIAINHSAHALAMYRANHPHTHLYCEDVRDVDLAAACQGRAVDLICLSPDCTYHSKARGGKPLRDRNRARRVRGLAWVACRWAKQVNPRLMILENVEEFADWGPLGADGKPCPLRKGFTFRRFVRQLQNLGYHVDWQELTACDYGAPTSRTRLYLIARRDRAPIHWPEPTHGTHAHPYRTAAECIDWSIPGRSIFERDKPLAEATLRRIARGLQRFVIECPDPYIVTLRGTDPSHVNASARTVFEPLRTISARGTHHFLVSPTLIQTGYGEHSRQAPRVPGLHKPLGTVVAGGVKHALISAFLAKHYGGHETPGTALSDPLHTITTVDHHALVEADLETGRDHREEVRAFLIKYYGTAHAASLKDPLHTITTRDRFGLVTIHGQQYEITDIRMRGLVPRELYNAQGFPPTYVIDRGLFQPCDGAPRWIDFTKSQQIHMCGNSVSPPVMRALIQANYDAVTARPARFASGRLF